MTITRSSAGNRLVPKEPGKKNKVLEQLGNAQDRPPFHFSVMGPLAYKRLQRQLVAPLTSAELGKSQRKNKSGAQQNNRPS